MAKKTGSDAKPSDVNVTAPEEGPPIPDPLGDDPHVRPAGRLTSDSPDHQGLLGAGSEPLPDGGVREHPVHDDSLDDLGPEEYEALTDAPETRSLRRQDEAIPDEVLDELDELEQEGEIDALNEEEEALGLDEEKEESSR